MTRREHNQERLEVWLKLYAGQFQKTGGMINLEELGKPGPTVNVPDWIAKRWSDPKVAQTDQKLAQLLDRLRRSAFELYDKLWIVHLSDAADINILERWKTRERALDRVMIELYQNAIKWLLNRLDEDKFWLTIGVKHEQMPVSTIHEAKMQEVKARKERERGEIYDYYRSLDPEIPKMQRYGRTATRFSRHIDTVRIAVRYFESEVERQRSLRVGRQLRLGIA